MCIRDSYFGILLTSLGASWFKKQANRPLLIKNKTRKPGKLCNPPSCNEWNVEDHNIQNMTPQSFYDFPTPRSDDSSFQYEDDLTLFTESVKTPTAHPRKAKQVRIRTNFGCKDPGTQRSCHHPVPKIPQSLRASRQPTAHQNTAR